MNKPENDIQYGSARKKFLALSLESTRKSYYPQLIRQLELTRENEEQLQLLIDHIPARLSCLDVNERFVFVNQEFESTFGLKKDEIIGQLLSTIVGPKNYLKLKPYAKQALSGEQVHFEAEFVTQGENIRWYDIIYVPRKDSKGDVDGFYGMAVDLTEKKQMEQEKASLEARLHQAQKMEAIGTLAGGIAHDFNNILSGIFGYSQLAEIHIQNPELAIQYIQKVFSSAERASLLIRQILAFSRHTDINPHPLNVAVALKEVIKMLRSTLPKNIEIREKLFSRAKILADATQIQQVIMNLCTNAYHAMGNDGGILTVGLEEHDGSDTSLQEHATLHPKTYLKIEVSDTGPGIDPHIQGRIFEPYFTTKEMGKGTGLGLAVVDGIIKKHNGFIRLDSIPGKGTTFHVFLPVIEEQQENEQQKNKEIKKFCGSETIMLVDDESDIRLTLALILENQGYHVTAFEDGKKALQAFEKDPKGFDLVITDMTMSQMMGDDLSRRILSIRKDIPIILCTGYHENFTKEIALNMGIKAYVHKPVLITELSELIRKLLNNGHALPGHNKT
ncbi:MAG: ATP-binding protein [Pseudomonadota bacterium]